MNARPGVGATTIVVHSSAAKDFLEAPLNNAIEVQGFAQSSDGWTTCIEAMGGPISDVLDGLAW